MTEIIGETISTNDKREYCPHAGRRIAEEFEMFGHTSCPQSRCKEKTGDGL